MNAIFLSKDEVKHWQEVERLLAGKQSGDVSVAAQVGVTMEGGRRLRVDIQANAGYSCFQEVCCVEDIVYIGYGECIFVVHPGSANVELHSLDGYFGKLYTVEALEASPQTFAVLAASASELLSFSAHGGLRWRTAELGIDGVVVRSVHGGRVNGSGEWDPPGGWRDFTLCVDTGKRDVT